MNDTPLPPSLGVMNPKPFVELNFSLDLPVIRGG